MQLEIKQTVLETLKNIKKQRADLKDLKDKLYSNKADISSILLLVNEQSLQEVEYEINKNSTGRTAESQFRLISLGESYIMEKGPYTYNNFVIPINFSSFRFYHTNRGPLIFKCKTSFQKYPLYSIFLKGSLIFTTEKTEWKKFADFFDIKMNLFAFFGISLPEIQKKLLESLKAKESKM